MQKYLRLIDAKWLKIVESFNRPKFAYTSPASTALTNQCHRNTGKLQTTCCFNIMNRRMNSEIF